MSLLVQPDEIVTLRTKMMEAADSMTDDPNFNALTAIFSNLARYESTGITATSLKRMREGGKVLRGDYTNTDDALNKALTDMGKPTL